MSGVGVPLTIMSSVVEGVQLITITPPGVVEGVPIELLRQV